MRCVQCASAIPEKALFCPNCGQKVPEATPESPTDNNPQAGSLPFAGPPISPPVAVLVMRRKFDQARKVYQQETGASSDTAKAAIAWAQSVPHRELFPQKPQSSKSPGSHRLLKGLGIATAVSVVLFALLVVLGMIVGPPTNQGRAAVSTTNPTPTPVPLRPYRLAMSGAMPNPQSVGQVVTFRLHIKNTGKDIPNLTLWFQGFGSWTINNALCSCSGGLTPQVANTMGDGNAWAYGPLPHGDKINAVFILDATKVGNPDLSLGAFTDVDHSTGVPSGTQISNASLDWQGAIDP